MGGCRGGATRPHLHVPDDGAVLIVQEFNADLGHGSPRASAPEHQLNPSQFRTRITELILQSCPESVRRLHTRTNPPHTKQLPFKGGEVATRPRHSRHAMCRPDVLPAPCCGCGNGMPSLVPCPALRKRHHGPARGRSCKQAPGAAECNAQRCDHGGRIRARHLRVVRTAVPLARSLTARCSHAAARAAGSRVPSSSDRSSAPRSKSTACPPRVCDTLHPLMGAGPQTRNRTARARARWCTRHGQ